MAVDKPLFIGGKLAFKDGKPLFVDSTQASDGTSKACCCGDCEACAGLLSGAKLTFSGFAVNNTDCGCDCTAANKLFDIPVGSTQIDDAGSESYTPPGDFCLGSLTDYYTVQCTNGVGYETLSILWSVYLSGGHYYLYIIFTLSNCNETAGGTSNWVEIDLGTEKPVCSEISGEVTIDYTPDPVHPSPAVFSACDGWTGITINYELYV